MSERNIGFKVDEELYRTIKVKLAQEGNTLKDYIIGLILADINSQK